jgi:hypothetical protein
MRDEQERRATEEMAALVGKRAEVSIVVIRKDGTREHHGTYTGETQNPSFLTRLRWRIGWPNRR